MISCSWAASSILFWSRVDSCEPHGAWPLLLETVSGDAMDILILFGELYNAGSICLIHLWGTEISDRHSLRALFAKMAILAHAVLCCLAIGNLNTYSSNHIFSAAHPTTPHDPDQISSPPNRRSKSVAALTSPIARSSCPHDLVQLILQTNVHLTQATIFDFVHQQTYIRG